VELFSLMPDGRRLPATAGSNSGADSGREPADKFSSGSLFHPGLHEPSLRAPGKRSAFQLSVVAEELPRLRPFGRAISAVLPRPNVPQTLGAMRILASALGTRLCWVDATLHGASCWKRTERRGARRLGFCLLPAAALPGA